MPPMQMVHEKDPAQVLWDKLGKWGNAHPVNNQVLLGIYDRPAQTKGGIFTPDKYRDEEQWQGKACMVIMHGPKAFTDPEGRWFVGENIKVGDWVVIRPSDGFPISFNGVRCRMINDTAIRMVLDSPDQAW